MPDSQTPESVVQDALDAAGARRWQAVFDLIDRSDLPRWRRVTLSMLRHFERQPEAGRVLADWGIRDAAEAESLSDADLFARWMEAFSARTPSAEPQAPPPAVHRALLGSVHEGEETAHVVYREFIRNGSALRITTLRRTPQGWKLKVDHNLLGAGSYHTGPPQPASEPVGRDQ